MEENKEGNYRVKDDSQDEWVPSTIVSEPEAIKYLDNFSQAVQNPGAPILAERDEKILKLKPVFKKLVKIEESFIVYDEGSNKISYFLRQEEKEESSYLILFSIVSVILMIISNILIKKREKFSIATAFSVITFIFSIIIFAFSITSFVAIVFASFSVFALATVITTAFVAVVAIIITITSVISSIYSRYKISVRIFYILMAIHMILLFM